MPSNPDREQILAAILEEVVRRRREGEPVDDSAVLVEHRDVLPELAERLCALRLIESARKQARTPQPDESSGASPAAADPAFSIPG